MAKSLGSIWTRALQRSTRRLRDAALKASVKAGRRATAKVVRATLERAKPPSTRGDWLGGIAVGPAGARRYWLYRPPGLPLGGRHPLLVMLHGCGQTAKGFALSTRMNRLAARVGCFVLYPEQDRLAQPQGCWNWYDTRSGQSAAEAATLALAIEQVCLFHPVDRSRVAIAGMSAGASMAALMASREPGRYCAVAMHSGVAPGTAQSSASVLRAMRGQRPPKLPAGAVLPPLLVVQGGVDLVVAPRNGRLAAAAWAAALGAQPAEPREVRRGTRHAMTVTDYRLQRRTLVSLCEIGSLGHAWSGGDARQPFSDAAGPDASRLVWAFVSRRFERAAATRA